MSRKQPFPSRMGLWAEHYAKLVASASGEIVIPCDGMEDLLAVQSAIVRYAHLQGRSVRTRSQPDYRNLWVWWKAKKAEPTPEPEPFVLVPQPEPAPMWPCCTYSCPEVVDRAGKRCASCERAHWAKLLDLLMGYGFDKEVAEFAVAWQRDSVDKRGGQPCQPQ